MTWIFVLKECTTHVLLIQLFPAQCHGSGYIKAQLCLWIRPTIAAFLHVPPMADEDYLPLTESNGAPSTAPEAKPIGSFHPCFTRFKEGVKKRKRLLKGMFISFFFIMHILNFSLIYLSLSHVHLRISAVKDTILTLEESVDNITQILNDTPQLKPRE